MRVPDEAERDFVAGCLVVRDSELLLIDHVKHGVWLPPGGHLDDGETPDETAIRETREETGFVVELLEDSGDISQENYFGLPRPFEVNLHRVRKGHWHCDFLYRAKIMKKVEATHEHEHDGTKWFSREELSDESYEIPEYIRKAGRRAIETQKNKEKN